MAHGITESDTMFSVKAKPWHELGIVLNNAPNINDAIKLAGLSWEVTLEDLFTGAIFSSLDGSKIVEPQKVNAKAVMRQDTKKVLGVVGSSYTPLQNDKAFKWFEPFIDSGLASIETAGSLFEGRKTFMLAKLSSQSSIIVPQANDTVDKYILLSNSHDGSSAVRVGFTPIRVVCNNTLSMAHSDQASKLIRVRHSQNVETNLSDIQETMNLVNQQFEATAEQYRYLASKEINQDDLKKYITQVFEIKESEEVKRKNSLMTDIIELFETGRGNYVDGVRGTRWAAYNAVTEHLSYYQSTRGEGNQVEKRYSSLWFGANKSRNDKALELALSL